jgi:hypothetical protein
MDHNKILENNLIKKYLLHELTKQEESFVEEHLLYCEACLENVEKMKQDLNKIKSIIEDGSGLVVKQHRLFKIPVYWAAAAVLFVFFSTLGIVYILNNNEPIEPHVTESVLPTDSITSDPTISPDIPVKIGEKQVFAINYTPNSIYENEINTTYRHLGVKSFEPSNNFEIEFNNPFSFEWENSLGDSLSIVIIDNNGNELMNNMAFDHFYWAKPLKPGLYYWQIQTEIDVLHTGRFKIKPVLPAN